MRKSLPPSRLSVLIGKPGFAHGQVQSSRKGRIVSCSSGQLIRRRFPCGSKSSVCPVPGHWLSKTRPPAAGETLTPQPGSIPERARPKAGPASVRRSGAPVNRACSGTVEPPGSRPRRSGPGAGSVSAVGFCIHGSREGEMRFRKKGAQLCRRPKEYRRRREAPLFCPCRRSFFWAAKGPVSRAVNLPGKPARNLAIT